MTTTPATQKPDESAIETLRRRLSHHVLLQVARESGCAYTTVHRIAAGHTDKVYTDTSERLHAAMDWIEAEAGGSSKGDD